MSSNQVQRQSIFMSFLYGSYNHNLYEIRSAHYLYDIVNNQRVSDWQLQPLLKDTSNRFIGPIQANFPNYQAYCLHSEADALPVIADRKTPKQSLGASFIVRNHNGSVSAMGKHTIVFLKSPTMRVTQAQVASFVTQARSMLLEECLRKNKKPSQIIKAKASCGEIFY